jgi:hypothetical protein
MPAGAFVLPERSAGSLVRHACTFQVVHSSMYIRDTEDRWMLPREGRPKVPYGHPAQVTVSPNR